VAAIGKTIVIQMTRCILVLAEEELYSLLKLRPEIWMEAIKRGKGLARTEKSLERKARPP
jgi:hypothetical protein